MLHRARAWSSGALTTDAGMTVETLKVEGMTCVSCETTIKLALERTRGVRRAEGSYDRGGAVVEYDPKQTTHDKLRDVHQPDRADKQGR
jgi:copper chaperone CopZ